MVNPLGLKVGVALGGGAARGLAHLGVLRVLEREKVPIDVLVGTSMGAIIGGAYAVRRDIDAVEKKVREIVASREFKRNGLNFLRETKQARGGLLFSMTNLLRKGIVYGVSTIRPSFLSAEMLASSLEAVVPEARIEDLGLRFGAVTLDLETAEEIVICSGDLRQAVKASSAIPGILPPVRSNGRLLIDGGWVDKIPVLPAFRLGADVVIAVDITAGLDDARSYHRGVDIMVRANQIKEMRYVNHLRRLADVLIEPDIKCVHWADFSAFNRCIEAGDAAASAAIPKILQLLRHERLWSVLRPGAGRRLAELHLESCDLRVE